MQRPIIAIHQPNFFPWLGFFHKLARADVFVVLDEIAYPKHTWVNRTRLAVAGKAQWVTCPVQHERSNQRIRDVRIHDRAYPWRKKMARTIESNYARARCYETWRPWVAGWLAHGESMLADFNLAVIRDVCRRLEIDTRIVRQCELRDRGVDHATGSERLARICAELGGRTYLAGGGAASYEDISAYHHRDIALEKQAFVHPCYPQASRAEQYIAGLSVIDALMNVGAETTARMVHEPNTFHEQAVS